MIWNESAAFRTYGPPIHPNCLPAQDDFEDVRQANEKGKTTKSWNSTGPIDRAESLRRRAERLLAQADELESLPGEPEGEICMVWFTKTHGNSSMRYTYAAVRANNGGWYTTGTEPRVSKTWDELLDFIGRGEPAMPQVWLCTEVEEL